MLACDRWRTARARAQHDTVCEQHFLAPLTPSEKTLYWFGWGGSMGVMDLDERITVSYAMNKMAGGLVGDDRAFNLVAAVYAAIGKS